MFDVSFTHPAGTMGASALVRLGVRAAGFGAWWWYYATTEGASMS